MPNMKKKKIWNHNWASFKNEQVSALRIEAVLTKIKSKKINHSNNNIQYKRKQKARSVESSKENE